MTISPISLQWSFATDASNTAIGVRNDGSIIATYQSNSFLDYNLSASYGQLTVNNSTPSFIYWGVDWNYDKGDLPSVAIDGNGLVLSCHVENGLGSTIYLNFGKANGGQGGFVSPSFETSVSGNSPFVTCVGPGQFVIVDYIGNDSDLTGWQVQVFELDAGGYSATVSSITFDNPNNIGGSGWATNIFSPKASYSNGNMAIVMAGPGPNVFVGTYDSFTATFTVQCMTTLDSPEDVDGVPPASVALGPSNDIYVAVAGANDSANGNYQMNFYYGTYTQGGSWNISLTGQQILQDVNNGNYSQAVDISYITVDDYSGVAMAVLGETNCIDVFIIPESQFT